MSEHRIVDDRGRLLTAVGNVDLLVGGLWRWFATGYKPYLVVAFAITMTASALRAWWLTTRASEIHQLESVNDLLVSESEPGRNVAQAALLSAALGLGYVDTEFDCLASEDDAAYARMHGRSPGGQIFIHGQPNTNKKLSKKENWTAGCIAVKDREIEEIYAMVREGTIITIRA